MDRNGILRECPYIRSGEGEVFVYVGNLLCDRTICRFNIGRYSIEGDKPHLGRCVRDGVLHNGDESFLGYVNLTIEGRLAGKLSE